MTRNSVAVMDPDSTTESFCSSVLLPESYTADDSHLQDDHFTNMAESQSSWSSGNESANAGDQDGASVYSATDISVNSDGEESDLDYYDELTNSFYSVDAIPDTEVSSVCKIERVSFNSAQLHLQGSMPFEPAVSPEDVRVREASEMPLYDGAEINVLNAYLMIFQFAIRHSLTTKAFAELLHLIAAFLPLYTKAPKTVYALKSFFIDIFPQAKTVEHWYCSCCHQLLDSTASCSREGCSNAKKECFISVPLGAQLKKRMESMCTAMLPTL